MATLTNVEIFRAGTHTDSAGRTRTWSLADLKKIVARYDPSREEAPMVIGHPKQTAPAYGWLKQVKLVGNSLLGDFYQVADEFLKALKEGRYKKRSISLDRELRIQHVGFLGAALPGVTGLKDIEFSAEAGMDIYEFTTNEGAKPKEDDMELTEALAKIKDLEKALAEAQDEIKKQKDEGRESEYAAKLKEAEDKAKDATDALNEYKKQAAEDALSDRIEALVNNGKILPADKDDTLAFAKSMDGEEATMDFSKEDGSTEKVSPRERYLRKLEATEPGNLFSEFAKNGGSGGNEETNYSELSANF